MTLFGFGKKKEELNIPAPQAAAPACACQGSVPEFTVQKSCCQEPCGIRSVKVLGSGCKSCHALYEAAAAAVKELGMNLEVEYITDISKVAAYGVMSTPALVVNEAVVCTGRVLKAPELIRLFQQLGYR